MSSGSTGYFDEMFGFEGMRSRMFKHTILPEQEVRELVRMYQTGNVRAGAKLVEHNLKFVYRTTSSFLRVTDANFWDTFNEGCFGILRAAEDFDFDKPVKFITYAVWWIRQRQHFYLVYNSNAVTIPPAQRDKRKREYLKSLPEDAVEHGMVKRHGLKSLQLHTEPGIISLNAPAPSARFWYGVSTYQDILATEPDSEQVTAELVSVIPLILSRLKPEDAKLISDVYGLGTGDTKTYSEIGEVQHLSKERIRQKLQKALHHFRHELARMRDLDKTDLEVFS
jgi:RNA polymerase primary sigma factor